MSAVLRAFRLLLTFSLFVGAWLALGFLIAVFSTNPPPPIPGRENMIEFSRYAVFGAISFIIGMICTGALQGAWSAGAKKISNSG